MKKFYALLAPLALSVVLTACENVPAPYAEPVDPATQNGGTASLGVFIDESFAQKLGVFTNYTTSGSGAWKIDFKTAKASGYDNKAKTTTSGTYYLVSKEVDLSKAKSAHLMMEYILRYNKGKENQQLLITDKFDTNAPTANWTLLNDNWTEGSDWKTFTSYSLNLPSEWIGKKVRVAFRYNTDDKSGSTWEIKNFKLVEGTLDTTAPKDDTPAQPAGENLLTNGDFEAWTGGQPNEWNGVAGNAKISQSSTAHGGKHAVLVEGADSNKRLAYKALTLKPGDYTLHAYVRGVADGASARLGYVLLTDGKVKDAGDYKYGNYVNDLKATEWTAISHSFTLKKETNLCLLLMNPKKKGNLLVDDFMLTSTNGGIVAGKDSTTTVTPTPPPANNDSTAKAIYTKTLLDNAEGWTLNEGTVPTEVPHIWQQSSKYGLVATGYEKSSKKRYASSAIAISPTLQLGAKSTLTFEHAANFFGKAKLNETIFLLVREAGQKEWQNLAIPTMPSGKDFNYVASGSIDLSAWAGKKVQLGFKYTSTTQTAGTWEFKNIVVK